MTGTPILAILVGDAQRGDLATRGVVALDLAAVAAEPHGSELPGDVLLIDVDCQGAKALLEAYALRRPEVGVVIVGHDLSTDVVRTLFRFSASDVLSAGSRTDDLLAALEGVSHKRSALTTSAPAQSSAVCWVLTGAVGGAGVTTLAIEMAFSVLRRVPTKRVALVDLNLADGMSAAFLDGQKRLDVAGVCADPERIDETLLRAYAWEHAKGIHVFAAPRNPKADDLANEAGILQLLDVACSSFDHVIVDQPRHRTPWSDAVLSAADEVLVVSELTVPSLHAAADLCRDVDQLRSGSGALMVLNRMFAKRSHRHAFPVEKAEAAIHRDIDYSVRSDWDSARMAVNLGLPIAQVKSRSPLVKDVEEMVASLMSPGSIELKGAA